MKHPETYLVTKDNGVRPAGKPDRCFYCGRLIGEQHAEKCVLRLKTVVLEYRFSVTVTVPESWSEQEILFQRNLGSWCADNAADDMEKHTGNCLCGQFDCVFVRDATAADEEYWDLFGD